MNLRTLKPQPLWTQVVALCCPALGQPQPKPEEPRTQDQTRDEFDGAGSVGAALRAIFDEIVKLYAAEKAENATCEDRKERREESDLIAQWRQSEWAGWAAFLAGLAFFANAITIGLVYATFWQTRRTADASIIAATAAEDAVFEVEAPFLYPEISHESIGSGLHHLIHGATSKPSTAWAPHHTPGVSFKVANYGKGPAIFRSLKVKMMSVSDRNDRIALGDSIDADTPIIEPQKRVPEGTIHNYSAVFTPALDQDEAIKIRDGTKHVVLQGEIEFTGVHGADYVQSFGFYWEHSRSRLIPLGLSHNQRTRKRDRRDKRVVRRWMSWKKHL